MEENLLLEKEEHLQKEQILEDRKNAVNQNGAAQKDADSKETIERNERLHAAMHRFSEGFRSDWSEKRVTVKNGYGIVTGQYSTADFVEISSSKKRSGSAIELRNCILEMKGILSPGGKEYAMEDYMEKLFELSVTSGLYADSHRGNTWTTDGSGRAGIARRLRKLTSSALSGVITEDEENEIKSNAGADYVMGESDKTVTDELKKAAKQYRRFINQIAADCTAYTPREIQERRMNALRINERKLKLYRMNHQDVAERDPAIQEMIAAYEEGLRWEKLFAFLGKKEEKETNLSRMIENHLEEEGEIPKKEKLAKEEMDQELDKDQLKGIEEIDNWLIRNFQNGGAAGLVGVKNAHEDFVSAVLSLTKRERLHMYYLVETGKRKSPDLLDVGMSQSGYVPKLSAFRDQMKATKWKFWAYATGGYTYMHKLSEAFQITREYREEIRSVTNLRKEEKRLTKTLSEKKPAEMDTESLEAKRLEKLVILRSSLCEYTRNLKDYEAASGKKKEAEEAKCREMASWCQTLLNDLVKLDGQVAKAEIANRQAEKKELVTNDSVSKPGLVLSVPSYVQGTVNAASKYILGSSWYLENSDWAKMNLWAGSGAAALDGAANLAAALTTIYTLYQTGGQMSREEVAEKLLNIGKNAVSIGKDVLNVQGIIQTGGSFAADTSTALGKNLGIAGAALSGGIAFAKTVGYKKMKSHGAGAKKFFEEKRRKLNLKELSNTMTAKEKHERKYEENMMKLQEELMKREKKNAAVAWVNAGISAVSVAIPGMGVVSAGFTFVMSIKDTKAVTGIRTRLFDNFFNMDKLTERAAKSKEAKRLLKLPEDQSADQEKFRASLRKRVAACAGFCDVNAAADQICRKFAKLIRSKLFGGKAADEAEKAGYLEFVRSLNMKYDEEKQYPAENLLARKLAAY